MGEQGRGARPGRIAGGPRRLVLAIGDDRTDEDLFDRLHADDWSVKVGQAATRARFRLADPTAVRAVLALLAEDVPGAAGET